MPRETLGGQLRPREARGASTWSQLQVERSRTFGGVDRWGTYTEEAQRVVDIRHAYLKSMTPEAQEAYLNAFAASEEKGQMYQGFKQAARDWATSLGARRRRKHGI